MSTRRARIKAVAALPPRRKNADNADANRNKIIPKDALEKELKSPRTPRSHTGKNEEKSPAVKSIPQPSPPASTAPKTPVFTENVPSPKLETLSIGNTPKATVKVPVITSATRVKPTPNLFASPHVRSSPHRRSVDLAVRSPKPTVSSDNTRKIDVNSNDGLQSLVNNLLEKALQSNSKKNDFADDYSVPSVPESITEETVMDGIVPLQSAGNAPKPIALLKNEIISEYAEVLFDPIVPLPSPSKVRPKLRPVPRLAPHRRNSIQGSASESEDETRRAMLSGATPTPAPPRQRHDSHTSHSTLHSSVPNREVSRVRNDSVGSTISQATAQPPPATSPVKEKHFAKAARRQEMGKRMWRRRRDTVKRDALTMYDLIFYNPSTNPIIPDQDELKAKEENAKDEAERMARSRESGEDADDPPPADAAPVPQIKLGPNGEIMLDEMSLVIKQSDANRKLSSVVREGAWGGATGGRYTRTARTAEWSAAETVRFYRALAAVGTDFSLMAQLFPDRTRRDLKLKFKKEEKLNGGQVDKALRSATSWDVSGLQDEFREERADAARRADRERQHLLALKQAERERLRASREMRFRPSRGFKALNFGMEGHTRHTEMTAEHFINRHIETRASRKQKKKRETNTPQEPQIKPQTEPEPLPPAHPHFATLTLIGKNQSSNLNKTSTNDLATLSKVDHRAPTDPPQMPSNIETGSLVVLRVNDPNSPSKTMLQTYIAHGAGKLTPVALPSTFLNSVVGYMKLGTPKGGMPPPSPSSQDRTSVTPSVIQVNPSPAKRQRHSSYSITPL